MEPGRPTLQSVPPEVMSQIGQWLGQKDLGRLRMTSQELKQKAAFSWARFFEIFTVNFHPRQFLRLLLLVQCEAAAKAIRVLRIQKADPCRSAMATSLEYCCAAGHAQYILTLALEKMRNLQHIITFGNDESFDMCHVACDPSACPHTRPGHRILPTIFQAIKDSGVQITKFILLEDVEVMSHPDPHYPCGERRCKAIVPKLATEVLSGAKELIFKLARRQPMPLVPHGPYNAEAQMIKAAASLETLAIMNGCGCVSHGILDNVLPTTTYSKLRKVDLLSEGIEMSHLMTFLDNNHQIRDLSIYGINLAGGSWLPILKLLRDKFAFECFEFRSNSCDDGHVYSKWGGKYRTVIDASTSRLPEEVGWPWEDNGEEYDWGCILLYDDDGTMFPKAISEHGMREAFSLFIQGYYIDMFNGGLNGAIWEMINEQHV